MLQAEKYLFGTTKVHKRVLFIYGNLCCNKQHVPPQEKHLASLPIQVPGGTRAGKINRRGASDIRLAVRETDSAGVGQEESTVDDVSIVCIFVDRP